MPASRRDKLPILLQPMNDPGTGFTKLRRQAPISTAGMDHQASLDPALGDDLFGQGAWRIYLARGQSNGQKQKNDCFKYVVRIHNETIIHTITEPAYRIPLKISHAASGVCQAREPGVILKWDLRAPETKK